MKLQLWTTLPWQRQSLRLHWCCILLIQNQSSIKTIITHLRTVLLSTCLSPVLRHPALIIMETQVPASIQQWTQQPWITRENCSMNGGTSIITATGEHKHHTWDNMLFYIQASFVGYYEKVCPYWFGFAPYCRSFSATLAKPRRDAQKSGVCPRWFMLSTPTPMEDVI